MKVRLLAFAGVREILGSGEIEIELPDGSKLGDLRRLLDGRHPELTPYWERLAVAVDGQLGGWDAALAEGSEVALLPPVSGGQAEPGEERAALVEEAIDIEVVSALVERPAAGAVVIFQGVVRDNHRGRGVTRITYDAYRPMAGEVLGRIVREIEAEAPGLTLAIVHRIGELAVGEVSVVIAASSPHRDVAYDASRVALERLKREVPVWKREHYDDGDRAWREEEPLVG